MYAVGVKAALIPIAILIGVAVLFFFPSPESNIRGRYTPWRYAVEVKAALIPIVILIGIAVLFFFPSPQSNFLAYIGTGLYEISMISIVSISRSCGSKTAAAAIVESPLR